MSNNDRVFDNNVELVFSGPPRETFDWLIKNPVPSYRVAMGDWGSGRIVSATTYVENFGEGPKNPFKKKDQQKAVLHRQNNSKKIKQAQVRYILEEMQKSNLQWILSGSPEEDEEELQEYVEKICRIFGEGV